MLLLERFGPPAGVGRMALWVLGLWALTHATTTFRDEYRSAMARSVHSRQHLEYCARGAGTHVQGRYVDCGGVEHDANMWPLFHALDETIVHMLRDLTLVHWASTLSSPGWHILWVACQVSLVALVFWVAWLAAVRATRFASSETKRC